MQEQQREEIQAGCWFHTCEDCGNTVEVGMDGHLFPHTSKGEAFPPHLSVICAGSFKQVTLNEKEN